MQGNSRMRHSVRPVTAFCPRVPGLVLGVSARLCRSGDAKSRVCWPVGKVGSVPPGSVTAGACAGGHWPCSTAGCPGGWDGLRAAALVPGRCAEQRTGMRQEGEGSHRLRGACSRAGHRFRTEVVAAGGCTVGGEGCHGRVPCPTWACALAPATSPIGICGMRGKSEGKWWLLSSSQDTTKAELSSPQSGSQAAALQRARLIHFSRAQRGSRSGNATGKLQKGLSGASFGKRWGRRILLLLIPKQKYIYFVLLKGKWGRRCS